MSSSSPLPTWQETARDSRRSSLFQAAIAEFRRVGFDRASVARIATEAGVSRPTFYAHFPTKRHVLVDYAYALELEIAERLKRCRTLDESLPELVSGLLEAEERVAIPSLFRDLLSATAQRAELTPADRRGFPLLDELTRLFEDAARAGELRPGIEPARAAFLCMASVFGLFLVSPPEDRRSDFQDLLSLYRVDAGD